MPLESLFRDAFMADLQGATEDFARDLNRAAWAGACPADFPPPPWRPPLTRGAAQFDLDCELDNGW